MKTLLALILAATWAGCAGAQLAPAIRWDVQAGVMIPQARELSIRRGESVNIEPRYVLYGTNMALTGASVEMRYATNWDMSAHYSVTGSIIAADTGRVRVAWTDANSPTWTSGYYEIRAYNSSQTMARAYGALRMLGGMAGVNSSLVARTSIDWSTVAQSNGRAVLSNHMGSGASWNGTSWDFVGSGISAATATDIAVAVVAPWTNQTAGYASTAMVYAVSNAIPTSPTQVGAYPAGNPSGYVASAEATNIATAIVGPWTNQASSATLASLGGVTNTAAGIIGAGGATGTPLYVETQTIIGLGGITNTAAGIAAAGGVTGTPWRMTASNTIIVTDGGSMSELNATGSYHRYTYRYWQNANGYRLYWDPVAQFAYISKDTTGYAPEGMPPYSMGAWVGYNAWTGTANVQWATADPDRWPSDAAPLEYTCGTAICHSVAHSLFVGNGTNVTLLPPYVETWQQAVVGVAVSNFGYGVGYTNTLSLPVANWQAATATNVVCTNPATVYWLIGGRGAYQSTYEVRQ